MKKKHLIVGSLLWFQFFANAQKPREKKQQIPKNEIELVYNHYTQTGNNSAITGGIGTEELTVYGPNLTYKRKFKKDASVSIKAGTDIISSASTDKIDYIDSSASSLDARTYGQLTYSKKMKPTFSFHTGVGSSIESDYFSMNGQFGVNIHQLKKNRSFGANFQYYNDDLRWGRLNEDYYRPVELIYPAELRPKEFYDVYKRYSYNLKLNWNQVVNKRWRVGLFPAVVYQNGLLETPFHRIYFSDESLGVEQLPNNRWKFALGLKANQFVKGKTILKHSVQAYQDTFGIQSFSLSEVMVYKWKPNLMISPKVRWYQQSQADYFQPYASHYVGSKFYTSDYDLSQFQTIELGTGVKFKPIKQKNQVAHISYNYLHRSNHLNAHSLTLAVKTDF